MCGVFGYIGKRDALTVCLEGLSQLEYRGYDSTGIAGLSKKELVCCKRAGKLSNLQQTLNLPPLDLAIAHTRWATHGKVTDANAHPHFDQNKTLALVHNGIIENYEELKASLQEEGVEFSSETDTEVVAQLIAKYYQGSLVEAVHEVLALIKGLFAIVVIHKNHPQEIIAAARDCPLSIAINDAQTEAIISSDPNSFFGEHLNILFLRDGEIAQVKTNRITVFDARLSLAEKKMEKIHNTLSIPSRDQYAHFMLKEIFEQPAAMQRALFGRLTKNIYFDELFEFPIQNFERAWILGCGTSAHAGWLMTLLLEDLAQMPASYEIASEARYRSPLLCSKTLALAISQSGETADTLAALRQAKRLGCISIGLCNVKNSSLVREVEKAILLHAGPEISVCSTKAFTSQLTVLTLLALYIAQQKRVISQEKIVLFTAALKQIPQQITEILKQAPQIQKFADKYACFHDFFFIGRSYMLPTAMETALKVKEISYVHAAGCPAGELKHGPIALLGEQFPVVAFTANRKTQEKMMSNLAEIKARGAPILAFATENTKGIEQIADDVFYLPSTLDPIAPFTSIIVGQLFAYYLALAKGCNIDRPRNLAKSVTVE